MIVQNIRLPNCPLGKKLIIMVPPINITNIIIGVSQLQIGHMANMKLFHTLLSTFKFLPEERNEAGDCHARDEHGVNLFYVYVFLWDLLYHRQVHSDKEDGCQV